MHFAELIIIYLAYGAPFGVYDLSCSRKKPNAGDMHLIAAKFVFWPVLVGSWIRRWFLRGRGSGFRQLENEIEILREQLERTAFGDRSAAAILGFREVYARYIGLSLFLLSDADRQGVHPILEFGHDPETKAAAACIYRRDREKVALHQRQARAEFLDIIRQLSGGLPENDDLILISVEVATLIQDRDCTQGLYSLLPDNGVTTMRPQITFPKTAN
jgi:hypothetical protein